MPELSKFAHGPTIDRCLEALARERAKPPEQRRHHLVQRWRAEIYRTGGFVDEAPGSFQSEDAG